MTEDLNCEEGKAMIAREVSLHYVNLLFHS